MNLDIHVCSWCYTLPRVLKVLNKYRLHIFAIYLVFFCNLDLLLECNVNSLLVPLIQKFSEHLHYSLYV